MKINRQELQNALEKVRPGLSNREIIEQSTSFAFLQNKVVTYNDEISISHPVEGLDLTGAIKAQELYQLLSKVKQEEVDITWDDNQFKITAGESKAGLVLQQEVKLPIDEIGNISEWQDLPDNFTQALHFCRTSCSKDMSRPVLTCIHVKESGVIEASDGYRITSFNLEKNLPTKTFLIPANSVNELVKYKIKQIAEGEGWVHFRTDDNIVFSCRIFNDNYPDISPIFDFEGKEITLPDNMSEALERAQVFAKTDFDSDMLVSVSIADTKMIISTQSDSGWFEETVRIKYRGDPINFQAHPVFLSEMLNKVKECIISEDRMKFQADNWTHVIALTVKE